MGIQKVLVVDDVIPVQSMIANLLPDTLAILTPDVASVYKFTTPLAPPC